VDANDSRGLGYGFSMNNARRHFGQLLLSTQTFMLF
jgi:hypothetical protein